MRPWLLAGIATANTKRILKPPANIGVEAIMSETPATAPSSARADVQEWLVDYLNRMRAAINSRPRPEGDVEEHYLHQLEALIR
jgi:hypothetical protein